VVDGSGATPSPLTVELADDARPSFPPFWPGVVVDDRDPEKAGRLRIRVPQVYGATEEDERIEDRDLPWARPCFPVTGLGTGEAHVPPVGATVWVAWFGGNPEKPIWFGGWFTPGDAPPELSSSYAPGPTTRIVRTAGGQVFEMRWKAGEEHIHLRTRAGVDVDLVDTPAGPKLTLLTPAMQKVELNDATNTVTVETTGNLLVNAGMGTTTFTGLATYNFLAALVMAITGTLTLTATGLGLITVTGILSLFGASVLLGTAVGIKRRLVDERFFATLWNVHTHTGVTVGGGVTGPPPVAEHVPTTIPIASVATTDVLAS
jgi:hypothetical protein